MTQKTPGLCYLISGESILCSQDGLPLPVGREFVTALAGFIAYLPLGSLEPESKNRVIHFAVLEKPVPMAEGQWGGLRQSLGILPDEDFAWTGRAIQLARWLQQDRFCNRCGVQLPAPEASALARSEYVKLCRSCGHSVYPAIAPCVIMLITRGRQCLLAYHVRARREVYTTLAGFIEAGETPEQALMREVREEVGIEVTDLHYAGSQSWPFPGQLMLGFYAEYGGGEIKLDQTELLAADWFNVDDLPEIPSVGTIARRLIDGFVARCHGDSGPVQAPLGSE